MRGLDATCWCVGILLVLLIMWMTCENMKDHESTPRQTVGYNARAHANAATGQHTTTKFPESYGSESSNLDAFTWEAPANSTDSWNIPTMEGAKKGQTIQSGRLEPPQIRPCRLPGVDTVGALRPPLKPVTAGEACVSWGDSECRMNAINSETGCFGNSPDCGIASR